MQRGRVQPRCVLFPGVERASFIKISFDSGSWQTRSPCGRDVFAEHKDMNYCCLAFGLGDGVGLGDWGLGAGCTGGEAGASSGTDTVPSSLTATRRRRTFGVSVSVLGAG